MSPPTVKKIEKTIELELLPKDQPKAQLREQETPRQWQTCKQPELPPGPEDDLLGVYDAEIDPDAPPPIPYLEWASDVKTKATQPSSPPPPASTKKNPETRFRKKYLPPAMVPCRWYEAGYCARGDACWYLHDKDNIQIKRLKTKETSSSSGGSGSDAKSSESGQHDIGVQAGGSTIALIAESRRTPRALKKIWKKSIAEAKELAAEKTLKPTTITKSVITFSDSEESADEKEEVVVKKPAFDECAICQEVPTTYGILSECDHVYCLKCIRRWRDPKPDTSTARSYDDIERRRKGKECPCCRLISRYIIPSTIFPAAPKNWYKLTQEARARLTGLEKSDTTLLAQGKVLESVNPAKAVIIKNFLTRTKTIPCRNFVSPVKCIKSPSLSSWNPNHRVVAWDGDTINWDILSGFGSAGTKKIPYCRFGNQCHFYHPNPSPASTTPEEYTYSPRQLAAIKAEVENRNRDSLYGDDDGRQMWMPPEGDTADESPDQWVGFALTDEEEDWLFPDQLGIFMGTEDNSAGEGEDGGGDEVEVNAFLNTLELDSMDGW